MPIQAKGESMNEIKHVYTAIALVTKALSKEGIAKDKRNTMQNYAFRGIDDVYNALAPFLAEAELCVLPRYLTRAVTERETAKGGVLFYVVVEAEFDFVSAKDGSSHTVRMFGEAMDSGDKATNKAMSAAFKYACMQAFCIPTEGDNDADAQTHAPVSKRNNPQTTNRGVQGETATAAQPAGTEREIPGSSGHGSEVDIPDALIPIFDTLGQQGQISVALGEMRQKMVNAWPDGHGTLTYQRLLEAAGYAKGKPTTIAIARKALIAMHNVLKDAPKPINNLNPGDRA